MAALSKVKKDWRDLSPLLNKSVEADLTKYGFQILTDTEDLTAIKQLKVFNPPEAILIIVFPSKYPLKDIRAFIQSEQLCLNYLKRPIKHLFISDLSLKLEQTFAQGIVEICLRGAWNSDDYTKVRNVYNQVLSWFTDYNLGETFPEDFNLPEGTLFFPIQRDIKIIVPEYFLSKERKYFSEGKYGIFTLDFSDSLKQGILSNITQFTIEAAFKSATRHDTFESKNVYDNLFVSGSTVQIKGIWFYADIPPSVLAYSNGIYSVPIEKTYLYYYLKKNKARISLIDNEDYILCFFFELYKRKECIFLLVNSKKQDEIFQGCEYILPQKLTEEELYIRAGATINLNRIKNTKLLCLGLGAIGSQSAVNMARMGFKDFTLIDRENLVVGNIMRHQAGLNDVGKSKVKAMQEMIGKVSPFAECLTFCDILDDEIQIEKMNFDIAISAIADDRVESYINEQMVRLGKTCVYGRTTDTAYGCRIIRVIPKKDPCLKCLSYYSRFGDENYIQLSNEINQSNAQDYIMVKGCTSPSYIGVNIDIQLYANLLSRVVFETANCGEKKFYSRKEANHYIYATRTIDNEPKLNNPHTLINQTFLQLTGCPVCGDKNFPYSAVVILKQVLDKIRRLSKEANNVETGGVLIGLKCTVDYDDKPCLIITHATLPGPKAIKKPAFFERDKDYCTEMIKYYFEFSDGSLNYVGEWHSHTNSDVTPSLLDHKSLQKIVLDENYVVDYPVSIIQSAVDKEKANFAIYTKDGYCADSFIVSDGINIPEELKTLLIDDLDPCNE